VRLRRDTGAGWLDPLRTALERARVGVRIMAAGPELEVLDIAGAARAAGAIDAELGCFVTDDSVRRVQCPHCHAHTEARVAVGETVPCAGCARSLIVYHHVSRRHGAYLGYMVDAEEPGR
jgi:dimethylamine monooxygenase subunit C